MFNFIAQVLAFFYDVVHSYAGAIALLTLTVMLVMTPLTVTGTKSMLKMQAAQPKLKKLQEKHKGDREKLNQEMMAFYKEEGINPLLGCLPTLAQIPVFIVLFQVLRGLTHRLGGAGSEVGYALAGGTDQWDPNFEPRYIAEDTTLFHDLSSTNEMLSWGFDLAISPSQALSDGFMRGLPYILLVAVVGLTSWYQQRQIQSRTSLAAQNPQQQMIMKVLPLMLPVIAFTMPTGLVIYFVFSNLYRVAQQAWITKNLYAEKDRAKAKDTAKAKDKAKAKDSAKDSTKAEKSVPPAPKAKAKAKASSGAKRPAGNGQKADDPTDGNDSKATPGAKPPGGGSRSGSAKAPNRTSTGQTAVGTAPRPRKKKRKRN